MPHARTPHPGDQRRRPLIVSAGIHLGGASGKIIELIQDDELTLFTCPSTLEEYVEVLPRERFAKHLFPPTWLGTLLRFSTFRHEEPPPQAVAGRKGYGALHGADSKINLC